MYMPYSKNPFLPRVRMQAVAYVRRGWSIRKTAKHFGFHHTAVMRWVKKAQRMSSGLWIPTKSSRPRHHPKELPDDVVKKIIEYRRKYRRGAEVLHHLLRKDGINTSLSSVKRTLRRHNLVNHSKWKKWHQYPPRPSAQSPGVLVQVDTIVDGPPNDRIYIYTMLDVCSRWAFALPIEHISTHQSLKFVFEGQAASPFKFSMLQSDHGSEFSKYFSKQLLAKGLKHRHSRVRRPTDNGHLERFNRTIQEECLRYVPKTLSSYQKAIDEYLSWYNEKRPHMALQMKSPLEVVRSY